MPSRARPAPPLALCAVIVATGCGGTIPDDPTTAATFTVRDSAGVEIAENAGSALPPETAWRVAPEPTLSIGVVEGDPAYQLFEVEGAVGLPGGGVAILNRGSQEVRFFDAEGAHVATAGRQGEGPGEFTYAEVIGWFDGDTLGVWDAGLRRVSLITPDGRFVRSVPAPPIEELGAGPPWLRAFNGDGSMLFEEVRSDPTPVEAGIHSRDATYFTFREGGTPTPVGSFFRGEIVGMEMRGRVVMGLGEFDRAATVEMVPGFLVHGDARDHGFRMYDTQGTLLRIVRGSEPIRPLTRDVLDRHLDAMVEGVEDPTARASRRALIASQPVPDSVPGFRRIHVEQTEGAVWLLDYPMRWDETWRWTVFSREGVQLTRFESPPIPELLELGPDYILALERDEFDVERVVRYELIRPE